MIMIMLLLLLGAHGATDVTGFGILGHMRNLVECQKNAVSFKLHTLPSESVSSQYTLVLVYCDIIILAKNVSMQ